jgi:hypothetical protein
MLISKFNKLIRNKIVWAFFAILVSLSMVGLFAPDTREVRESRREGSGSIFGEDVPREEFLRARLFVQSFQNSRGGEDIQRQIDEEAWSRLAALRYAEKLGLRVTRDELISSIQRDRAFWDNGVFSMPRYKFLVEQQIGVEVSWFEEYMRQEILLERLRDFLNVSVWIPTTELDENAARFTDTFEVAFVKIPEDVALAVPEVGEAEAVTAHAASPDVFMVPERRRVIFTQFPHADYVDPSQITMRQIELRYESNPARFEVKDPETEVVTQRALAEVEDEIRLELAMQEAVALASEKAMELVDVLSLADRGKAVNLGAAAEAMSVSVSTSDWLRVTGAVPEGISAGTAFAQAAFQLSRVDPGQSFSLSVPGTNAFYVMQLHEVSDAYLPAFDDVREDAFALARRKAREAAFEAHVQAIHKRMVDGLRDGSAFDELAERESLPVTAIPPFVLVDANPREIPFFGDLAPDLLPLQGGDLTDPITTEEGSLIAYVRSREPGTLEARLSIKPDLTRMMSSAVEQPHFDTWLDSNLQEARK